MSSEAEICGNWTFENKKKLKRKPDKFWSYATYTKHNLDKLPFIKTFSDVNNGC